MKADDFGIVAERAETRVLRRQVNAGLVTEIDVDQRRIVAFGAESRARWRGEVGERQSRRHRTAGAVDHDAAGIVACRVRCHILEADGGFRVGATRAEPVDDDAVGVVACCGNRDIGQIVIDRGVRHGRRRPVIEAGVADDDAGRTGAQRRDGQVFQRQDADAAARGAGERHGEQAHRVVAFGGER